MPSFNDARSSNKLLKRCHEDSESDSDSNDINKGQWPSFLVISPKEDDQSLGKFSPFAVAKAVKGLAGEVKDIKVLQSGKILIECAKKQQSENLLKSKMFINIPIEVTPHGSLNFCRGVVRSRDLRNCSEGEMLEELKDQKVAEVKRITITKNGNKIATNTFILKFSTSSLPASIKAGYLNIPVEPFVPNPLRCFNCQRFGHHKDKCQKTQICARCGQDGHDSSSCENPIQCYNCKGEHFAHSKECAKYKQEKEIQTIKVKDKLSFQEARRRVLARGPGNASAQSYADVVRAPQVETKSVEVQTLMTWPKRQKEHKMLTAAACGGNKVIIPSACKPAPTQSASTQSTSTQSIQPSQKEKKKKSRDKDRDKTPTNQRDPARVHNPFDALSEDMELGETSSSSTRVSPKGKGKSNKKIERIEPPI